MTGCPNQDCSNGNAALGAYPATFVKAVKDEGTGRITSGSQAGRYLNWSYDVGYWLDSVPCNTHGNALTPWVSAAADGGVLRQGARFRLQAGFRQDDGSAVDAGFASMLGTATWNVDDQFTPGLGGAGHLDLYIGEENQVNFMSGPRYITMSNATIIML